MPDLPALSVVLVAPVDFDQIRLTVEHLLAQTALDRMELVVVAPSRAALGPGAVLLDRFPSHRIVEVGPISQRGRAAAEGIPATRAPVVAFVEEHAFPEPGWAEAFLRAHAGPWAAVSPVMRNANPDSVMSWTNWYRGYLGLTEPLAAGEVQNVAWHNSAYKREVLLAVGDRLPGLLDYEGDLLAELRAAGHRFYLEPAAQTAHLNVERVAASFDMFFQNGRLGGASRAARERWPAWRRLVYVAGSPLTPLMYVPGLSAEIRRTGQPAGRVLRSLPSLGLGLVVMAVGEAVGLLAGAGRAKERMESYELDRTRHLSRRTRARYRVPAGQTASPQPATP